MKALDLIITDTNLTLTVVDHEGEKWVPLKPICLAIGLQPHMQTKRVQEDNRFMSTQLSVQDSMGRCQNTTFIPLQQLEAFLFTINTRSSMKPEVAHRLLEFQKGLTKMIHKAFNNEMLTNEMYVAMFDLIKELKQENMDLKTAVNSLSSTVDYFVHQNALNEHYVDKRLASVGGKLLSSIGHKRRRSPEVA